MQECHQLISAASDQSLQGQRIIIADDNRDFQVLLRLILESQGARVLEALDGLAAITLAEAGLADAILMDIHMPAMDGYEAAKTLRDRGNPIPIVALSASPVCGVDGAGPLLEFDACVEKPVDFDRLFETIRLLTHA